MGELLKTFKFPKISLGMFLLTVLGSLCFWLLSSDSIANADLLGELSFESKPQEEIDPTQCAEAEANPWVAKAISKAKKEAALESTECLSSPESIDRFFSLAAKRCSNSYLDSRIKPVKKLLAKFDDESSWEFVRSLYLWPGSFAPSSLAKDSIMKLLHCVITSAAESLPVSKPDREFYHRGSKVAFHGLSLFLTTKSLLITSPFSAGAWDNVQRASYSSSIEDRKQDFIQLLDQVDLWHQRETEARQDEVIELVQNECRPDLAADKLEQLREKQAAYLGNHYLSWHHLKKQLRCQENASLVTKHKDPFAEAYHALMSRAAKKNSAGLCKAAIALVDTWTVYNKGLPLVAKRRQQAVTKFTKERQRYEQALNSCDYLQAEQSYLSLEQISQTTCGWGLDPTSVMQESADKQSNSQIGQHYAISDVGSQLECSLAAIGHFGAANYFSSGILHLLFAFGVLLLGFRAGLSLWLKNNRWHKLRTLVRIKRKIRLPQPALSAATRSDPTQRHLTSKLLSDYSKNDTDSPSIEKLLIAEGIEWTLILLVLVVFLSFAAGVFSSIWSGLAQSVESILGSASSLLEMALKSLALLL